MHDDDVPNRIAPSNEKREIDEAVGALTMGVNFYVARPGQRIPFGMHSHPEQEELFYALAGGLVFETPDEAYRIGADELFFVRPDSPHRARAAGDESARVLAIGAPGEADQAILQEECPHCDDAADRDFSIDDSGPERELVVSCATCGAETDRYTRGPSDD